MITRIPIKFKAVFCLIVLLACTANVMAAFSTAAGYGSTQLYSTEGTYTTLSGLALDAGKLYFGHTTEIKTLQLSDNSVQTAGTVPAVADTPAVLRNNGTTYAAVGTSYDYPYPYSFGYLDSGGNYVGQLTMDGIYDVAVNSLGDGYIVSNPGDGGSKIFEFDWSSGLATEIADIGGYSGGLAFDSDDNLYYAEQTNGQILKFTASEIALGGLTIADADVVLNIAGGYIHFDGEDNFYATTGWGATLAKYDLTSQLLIEDIAYGGIGQFIVDGETIYALDTDWIGFYSTVQAISIPEPATIFLFGLGGWFLRRRKG